MDSLKKKHSTHITKIFLEESPLQSTSPANKWGLERVMVSIVNGPKPLMKARATNYGLKLNYLPD